MQAFLTLIENERLSCVCEVSSLKEGKGFFLFRNGVLYNAKKGEVLGVLHHDSADFNAFDEIDVEYLSRIAEMIEETIANLDS